MNKPNKKEVIADFVETSTQELHNRYGLKPTPKDIVFHFVKTGIINPVNLRDYLLIKHFDYIIKQGTPNMVAFSEVAERYEITERHAQNIVYGKRKKYDIKANIK